MAQARLDRMSEREKHRTQGGYYLLTRNYPKAIEEFTALVEKYPSDTSGFTNLAFAHSISGNMAKAAEMGRKAVALNPNPGATSPAHGSTFGPRLRLKTRGCATLTIK